MKSLTAVKPNKKAGLNCLAVGYPTMPDRKTRAERRTQQAAEVEASQAKLRSSIAETERLVGESDMMLRRHRKEWDDDHARLEGQLLNPAGPKPSSDS